MTEVLPVRSLGNIESASEPIRSSQAISIPIPSRDTTISVDNIKDGINADGGQQETEQGMTPKGDDSNSEQENEAAIGIGPRLTRKHQTERLHSSNNLARINKPELLRGNSCPELKYDDCREFDAFAGEWIDSKGQNVLISPWGVIRYPNNPKLRFEAVYMGPNHLSVTFDKDPKRRKFVGKLNHDNNLLIWSNDTKWAKKGCKHDPRFQPINGKKRKNSKDEKGKPNMNRNGSCLVQ